MMKSLFGLVAVCGLLFAVGCGGDDDDFVSTCEFTGTVAAADGSTCNYCVDLLEDAGDDTMTTDEFDDWCAEAGGDNYTGNLCGQSYTVATTTTDDTPGVDVWAQNEECGGLIE